MACFLTRGCNCQKKGTRKETPEETYLDPKSTQKNCPKPMQGAQKDMILQTCWVQLHVSRDPNHELCVYCLLVHYCFPTEAAKMSMPFPWKRRPSENRGLWGAFVMIFRASPCCQDRTNTVQETIISTHFWGLGIWPDTSINSPTSQYSKHFWGSGYLAQYRSKQPKQAVTSEHLFGVWASGPIPPKKAGKAVISAHV